MFYFIISVLIKCFRIFKNILTETFCTQFVKVVTSICRSCYIDLSKLLQVFFAKPNQAEVLPKLWSLLKRLWCDSGCWRYFVCMCVWLGHQFPMRHFTSSLRSVLQIWRNCVMMKLKFDERLLIYFKYSMGPFYLWQHIFNLLLPCWRDIAEYSNMLNNSKVDPRMR